ncbi:MAG: SIMPL domain-containing protein [Sphingobacteriales bacterium]|nr:MAG: SIMPL domain-containing protein [Sphingobacteriales bacterium]
MRTFPLKTLITALAAIIIAAVVANGYNYKFKTKNTLPVTGSAEYNFEADLIVWTGSYMRTSVDLKEAYALLKDDEARVRAYLQGKGITAQEVVFSSVTINRQYDEQYDDKGNRIRSVFNGFQLSQRVRVESPSIEKVEVISREVTGLLEAGVELNSDEPQYYYTKLKDVKIKLLQEAGEDARRRAETIAAAGHSDLGKLRKASMGVFQITGRNSNEDFTYGGAFNTASKAKTATVTVRLEYELE